MAKLGGGLTEVFHVAALPDAVVARFLDTAAIIAATTAAERTEVQPDGAVRFVLKEMSQGPVRFQPDYVVRYERDASGDVVWRTVRGNLENTGRAHVVAQGQGSALHYEQRIAFDLAVPSLLLRGVQPVVDKLVQPSIRRYLDAMLKGL